MIINILFLVIFITESYFLVRIIYQRNKLIERGYRQTEKFKIFFDLITEWFAGYMMDKNIVNWILGNGYKTIAIYGMSTLGELTYLNLRNNGAVYIKYGLDRRTDIKVNGLDVYNLNDNLECVDLIIVTAITSYEEIEKEIKERIEFECKIVSLRQLLEEMFIIGDLEENRFSK